MKRKLLVVLMIFVCGCGPSEESKVATVEAKTMAAAQENVATSTPRLVPSKTTLPDRTETPSPTPFSINSIDLSKISLRAQDLTGEFFAIPPVLINFSKEEIQAWYSDTDIEVMDAFFFTDEKEQRYILGYTSSLITQVC